MVSDPAVARVMGRMAQRSEQGMKKYGVAIGDFPGDLSHWLLQLQEELTDAAIYIERALLELNKSQSTEA